MIKQTIGIVSTLAMGLLWASGCSPVRVKPEQTQSSPVFKKLVTTTHSWDGQVLPTYPNGQPEISILRIIIPAGARLKTHLHPVINAGVLLRGQLTVVSEDGKTLHLRAGDPIVELVQTLHYGVNQGGSPAEIIVFYAGVTGSPITLVEP
ncbi:MAG: cupin domain-containing protein [Phycisphaerales bacterium]|nr:cupin domain-containing protein [Phycisphaerales bacterium]